MDSIELSSGNLTLLSLGEAMPPNESRLIATNTLEGLTLGIKIGNLIYLPLHLY